MIPPAWTRTQQKATRKQHVKAQSFLHDTNHSRLDIKDTILGIPNSQFAIDRNIVHGGLIGREFEAAHDVCQRQVDLCMGKAIISLAYYTLASIASREEILLVCGLDLLGPGPI